MTVEQFLSIASDIGVIGLLLGVIWGGAKQFWVWGWSHRERVTDLEKQLAKAEKRGDEWMSIALGATDLGKRMARVAEKRVEHDLG